MSRGRESDHGECPQMMGAEPRLNPDHAPSARCPECGLSAVCVGGTFMIITMAGIKEALRLGGAPASLAVGVMTAAFGAGQIVGPLMVSLLARSGHAFALTSFIAAASLVAGNLVLLAFDRPVEPQRI